MCALLVDELGPHGNPGGRPGGAVFIIVMFTRCGGALSHYLCLNPKSFTTHHTHRTSHRGSRLPPPPSCAKMTRIAALAVIRGDTSHVFFYGHDRRLGHRLEAEGTGDTGNDTHETERGEGGSP